MAESHGAEGGHPVMDYPEHEKTYEGFIRFAVLGSIWCATIVVALAIGGPGKSWGWTTFLVLLSTVATAVGIGVKSINAKAAGAIFVLSLLVLATR